MPKPTQTHPKPQFSGHETFPLRQLWLRKAYKAVEAAQGKSSAIRSVFADEDAIRRFGVGKNMVSSIRHWALACRVLDDADGSLKLGDIGDLFFGDHGVDPYLEKPASAWLVHWLLAGEAKRSAAWHWVFNRVSQQSFTRATLQSGLQGYVEQIGIRLSPITIRRDIEVCVRCYLSRRDGKEADDSAEPLLSDLGLLVEGAGDGLQFRRGSQPSLPDGIFAYALIDFWETFKASGQRTLSLEALTYDFGSPGRVFKLDENSVAERVLNLHALTGGKIHWSDSAGIRQVSFTPEADPVRLKAKVLRGAYGR